MSDGNKRDIELRIRAQDLSTASFQQVSAAIKDLTANIGYQVEAAKRGQVSSAELKSTMTQLEQAAKSLANFGGLIDQFKSLTASIEDSKAKVAQQSAVLDAYRAKLDETGNTTKKAQRELSGLEKQLATAEGQLRNNQEALERSTASLGRAGISTAELTEAMAGLRQAADTVGPALTTLGDATSNYAKNARIAKEAAAALKVEQEAAAKAAKTAADQAAAVDGLRNKLSTMSTELREKLSSVVESNRQEQAAEQAKYDAMLASAQNFNAVSRALARQRANESAQNAVQQTRTDTAEAKARYEALLASTQKFNADTRVLNRQRDAAGTDAVNQIRRPQVAGSTAPATSTPGASGGPFGLRPYELQNLSYQINDIITGLASGQHAFQIFAQQGGQVFQIFQKNIFDLVKYLPAIALGVGAVTVAVSALSAAFKDIAAVREYTALLNASGNGANYSAQQLAAMRHELVALGIASGDTDKILRQAVATNIPQGQIGTYAAAARGLSDLNPDKSVPDAFKALTDAASKGVEGIRSFNREYNVLTASELAGLNTQKDVGAALKTITDRLIEQGKNAVGPTTQAYRDLKTSWDQFIKSLSDSGAIQTVVTQLTSMVTAIGNGVKTFGAFVQLLDAVDKKYPWLKYVTGPGMLAGGANLVTGAAKSVFGSGSPVAEATLPSGVPQPGTEAFNNLVGAIIKTESNGNQSARSSAGATGLMQLMPDTAADLGVNAYDAKQNVQGGTHYIWQMLQKYGNIEDALAAYNWGPGNVDKWIKGGRTGSMPAQTQAYIQKVTGFAADGTGAQMFAKSGAAAFGAGSDLPSTSTATQVDDSRRIREQMERQLAIQYDLNEAAARRAVIRQAELDADQKLLQGSDRQRAIDIETEKFDREKQLRDMAFQHQITDLRISDGKNAEAIAAAGLAARQKAIDLAVPDKDTSQKLISTEQARTAELQGQEEMRKKLQQDEKQLQEARTISNTLASLQRQIEAKDIGNISAALDSVKQRYTAVRQEIEKFKTNYPNATVLPSTLGKGLAGTPISQAEATVNALEAKDSQQTEGEARLKAINELIEQRNALVAEYKSLQESGTISSTEAEDRTREAFEKAGPAINTATEAFRQFLSTANLLDPNKVDLYKAKLQEFGAQAKYVSPEFKELKTTIENSFSSNLSNAFNTVTQAIGNAIAKTGTWKDVFKSLGTAAANFFSGLLKDIATAIIKMEALKLLGLGGGGGISGGIAGLFTAGGSSGGLFGVGGLFGSQGSLFGTAADASIAAGGPPLALAALHSGGVVGFGSGTARSGDASWFANAPRYHTGTVVGLAPDEQAAILKRGEEVLSADNPRNVMNSIRNGGGSAPISIRSVLVQDPSAIPAAMAGAHGERVIVNTIVKNAATVRQLVRG